MKINIYLYICKKMHTPVSMFLFFSFFPFFYGAQNNDKKMI